MRSVDVGGKTHAYSVLPPPRSNNGVSFELIVSPKLPIVGYGAGERAKYSTIAALSLTVRWTIAASVPL